MKKIAKESKFEKDIKFLAPVAGMRYYKIPDTKMVNAHNRNFNREEKRPFDGVLVTPDGNVCIECKVNYNKMSFHQKVNHDDIVRINGNFYVLRKIFRKKNIVYRIEQSGDVMLETERLDEMINFFIKK